MVIYGCATTYPKHGDFNSNLVIYDFGKIGRNGLSPPALHGIAWAWLSWAFRIQGGCPLACLTTGGWLGPSSRNSLPQGTQTFLYGSSGLYRDKKGRFWKALDWNWHSVTSTTLAKANIGPAQGETGFTPG